MKMRFTIPGYLVPAALLLVFGLAACDTNPSAVDEEALDPGDLIGLSAKLAADLDLSAAQVQAVDDLLGGDAQRGPGYLWTRIFEVSVKPVGMTRMLAVSVKPVVRSSTV